MFHDHFGHSKNFKKLKTLPLYLMWMTNEKLLRIWVYLSKFRWSPSSSKWEGPHEVILVRLPLFPWSKQQQTKYFPNPSGQVVHTRHLVFKQKILMHLSNIWNHPHNKQCQPNKKIRHAWSMRFLYVILTHMVVGTTPHQQTPLYPPRLPPIGKNRKPSRILGDHPFWVAWSRV